MSARDASQPAAIGAVNVSVGAALALDSDGDAGLASNALAVNYQQVNRVPTIAAVADQTTVRGTSVNLQIVASDPDGQTLTYSASGLPAGLAINATGLISGSVSAGAAASSNVFVTGSDGGDFEPQINADTVLGKRLGVRGFAPES